MAIDDASLPMNDLCKMYQERYATFGRADDLDEAIKMGQMAITTTDEGHLDFPNLLNNLGNAFCLRFERTGDLGDISQAIEYYQRAVRLTPDGHAYLPLWFNNLGSAFSTRFGRTGNLDDISHGIQNQQHAIQLTPDGHPELPAWLSNLGKSLLLRFQRTGHLDDIVQAVQNGQRGVRSAQDGYPHLPVMLSNLGTAFVGRFKRTGDLDDISQAIQVGQRAVQLTSEEHTALPSRLNNLGNAFLRHFEHTGDLDDISQAIQNYQRAVRHTPDGHARLPCWLNNLGLGFFRRFGHAGDLDDISQAIQNYQRAVQLTPDGHPTLPARHSNLGTAFFRRFKRTGDLDDISQSIENGQHAVRSTPYGHASLPPMLNNLGNAFLARFVSVGDLNDISQAIQNHQTAIQLTPEGHAHLPDRLNNLGNAFFRRFEHKGDLEDISDAIQNQQRAIQLTPARHSFLPTMLNNLATAFFLRFQRTNRSEFLSKAVENYRISATSPTGPPSVRLKAAKRWADLSRQPVFSSQLLDAFACIIQLLSLVSGLDRTIQRRHETLADSSGLSIAACAAALSFGLPDKAVEWLLEGRCIVWNQINQLRTPLDDLRTHDQALAERFSAVSDELEGAASRTELRVTTGLSLDDRISLEKQAGRHIKLVKERDRLLATIRNIAGFEYFLQPRNCTDVMGRLPDDGTVVIINIHSDRCDALALMAGAGEPMHIPLPNFSYQEADRLAKGLRGYLLRCRVISRIGMPLHDGNDPPSPNIDLVEVLSVLWSQVVWPILESLAFPVCVPLLRFYLSLTYIHYFQETDANSVKLPRIWWCPTGPLAFLPIHAAGIYSQSKDTPKRSLCDFAISSYIPTVNTLLKPSESNSIKKRGDAPSGLLIVSQPNSPKKTQILGAAEEAKRVAGQLEKQQISSTTLIDESATIENVLKAMESFSCIHLACHASQNTTNPLKSSIYLHDGPLELSEIIKRSLPHSDFAFLSACQTSTGDENLPEEVVHLAAGMLTAGYRSVVGTMWSVFDSHGPDLAECFYESLLDDGMNGGESKIDGAGAARALHHAMCHLRESLSDSSAGLLAWVPYIHIGI